MPSVEEALKISEDFLQFAKEIKAENALKEKEETERRITKVKIRNQN